LIQFADVFSGKGFGAILMACVLGHETCIVLDHYDTKKTINNNKVHLMKRPYWQKPCKDIVQWNINYDVSETKIEMLIII